MNNDHTLKKTFNTQAELYNQMRPTYPQEVFDTLIEVTKLKSDAQLLEIGPGTGQATVPLAKLGHHILGIELGDTLAEVARRELSKYPNVKILAGAFEDINVPAKSFDLIYSATAFHWIQPEVQFTKTHTLLKDGGYLAIIHRNHIGGDAFFEATNPIYRKYKEYRPRGTSEAPKVIKTIDDIKQTITFDETYFKSAYYNVFPESKTYTADEYIQLISTYSPTLSMPEEQRKNFLQEIHEIITNKFNGSIERPYGISLTIGRKKKLENM